MKWAEAERARLREAQVDREVAERRAYAALVDRELVARRIRKIRVEIVRAES